MRFSSVKLARKIADLTLKHSNLPESYVKRLTEVVEYQAPKLPQYRQITLKKYKNHYDIHRPWSNEFAKDNYPMVKSRRKIWVEPIKDWRFFKGDRVEVLTGKDKGKQGIIVSIIQERNWVIVQGLNLFLTKKKVKNSVVYSQQEAPLLINREVALVDPTDLKATEVVWRYDDTGNRVRVSVRTGKILPIPIMEQETFDYKTKDSYVEQEKDTEDADLSKVTFVPKLSTFEMDLMEEYKIDEDRVPGKTYWY